MSILRMGGMVVLGAVAMALGGCAGTSNDDVAAAAGAASTGTCAPDAYGTWFDATYRPALAAVVKTPSDATYAALSTASATKPCSVGDTAYLSTYFPVWKQRWGLTSSRRDDVQTSILQSLDQSAASALLPQLALTPDEDRLTGALSAGAPTEGGARSYAAWLEVYADEFNTAINPILGASAVFSLEPVATIDASESEILARVEAVRPHVTETKALAPWVEAYGNVLDVVFDSSTTTIDENTHAALARFVATQPASSTDADYLAFFESYDDLLERLGAQPSPQDLVRLTAWEMAKPAAGGDSSYGKWLSALGDRISVVNDAADPSDAAAVEAQLEIASLLKVKPCSGPLSAAKFAPIATRVASVPALASLAQTAAPTNCPAD